MWPFWDPTHRSSVLASFLVSRTQAALWGEPVSVSQLHASAPALPHHREDDHDTSTNLWLSSPPPTVPCMDGRRAGPWQSRPKTLTDEPLPKAWASQLCPDGGIMVHCCGKHESLRYKPLPNDKVVIHTWVKISVCMLTKNVMFLLCKDFSDMLKNVDTKTKVCGQTSANLKSHLKNVPGY